MHALTTLNDITYVEAAAAMARVALKSSSVDVDRLRTVAKRVLCRDLSPPELAVWMRTIERSRKAFEQDVHAAERLLGQLSAVKDGELQPAIQAAWTMLCLNLLNLDETLTKE
jgi:hypothetical protein